MKKICLIIAALIFIVYGCVTPKMVEVPETMTLKEPPPVPAPPPKPRPPAPEEIPQPKEKGLFSLSLRDADIRDVLLLLSKDSGMNIIADKDVTGRVSVDFVMLDLKSALYAITKPLGYTFRMEKGFIRVSRPMLETRAFKINYITGKRASTSTMNAAISTAGTGSSVTGPTTSISISTAPTTAQATTSASTGQGNVSITTSGTSDFWKEIRKGLEVIIFGDSRGGSDSEGGYSRGDEKTGKKLIINDLAGIMYVTDYSDNMENIENFLEDIQRAVGKQVMIQAHIIEVALNDGYKYGIDWSLFPETVLGVTGNFTFSQKLAPTPPTEPRIFSIDFSNKKVDTLLDAMKEQGQVNVLSSPKISTLNNQKAVIKLTTKEVSWVRTTVVNAEGDVLSTSTVPQIDETGLFLDVTPQIDDSGIITMQIHPSISEKKKESVSPDGLSTKPIIDTREVDTMIKVKNGQTIVIAGLITDKITESTKGVPFLMDIPVLGLFFKQIVQDKKKSELVILLTPYVLTDLSIEEITKEHEERLKRAGRSFEPEPVLIQKE